MPDTAAITRQLPAVAPEAPAAALPEPDDLEYPEGRWTAQSLWHGDAVRQATVALLSHFRRREDVLGAMELRVHYERGNTTAHLQPDLQVVFGVGPDRNWSSFKVWEEGRSPDFVLEVASPSTAENGARHKAGEYAGIGVREYWRLDPEGSLMGSPLEGYAASGGRYGPVEAVGEAGSGGWLRSEVLDVDLGSRRRDGAMVVVFRDPRTGKEFDGGLEEAQHLRRLRRIAEERARDADDHAQRQADMRHVAEERVRALEERLRKFAARARPEA